MPGVGTEEMMDGNGMLTHDIIKQRRRNVDWE
jgi:hypothetical protein